MTIYGPEFRWEYLPFGQGHYILAKDIEDAINSTSDSLQKEVIVIQQWKPERGAKYALVPPLMEGWTKEAIVRYYVRNGCDEKLLNMALENLKEMRIRTARRK